MKLRALFVALFLLAIGLGAVTAQSTHQKTLVSFNPLGPIVGIYQGSYEQPLDQHLTFFVAPTYFNLKFSVFGSALGAGDSVWEVYAIGGANYYLKTAPKGLYAGGGLGLGYAQLAFSGVGQASGVFIEPLAHVGYRFIWGIISLAPQIGAHFDLSFVNTSALGSSYSTYAPSGFGLDYGIDLSLAF